MLGFTTYGETLEYARAYIRNDMYPENDTIFEMSLPALKNTLKYVFEYLNHTCYILCVKAGVPVLRKIEPRTTSDLYKRTLSRAVKNLDKNGTLTDSQRKYIKNFVRNPLRIMQCVMKKYTGLKDSSENEYLTFFKKMRLPDGVFLLSLNDTVILREDGFHPFENFVGRIHRKKYDFSKHIPILSLSGKNGFLDMVLPNYDDVINALSPPRDIRYCEWSKKDNAAVFRGGASGCGYTQETNARIRISTMRSPLIDAGIVGKTKTVDSTSVKFDPVHGLGMMNTGLSPKPFMTLKEQSRFKYIVHIDGNVNAYRLLTTMKTGSVILRVVSEYTSWADKYLKPDVHYVGVRADLTDLEEKIEWCVKNDAECRRIAESAAEMATFLTEHDSIYAEIQNTLWESVSADPDSVSSSYPNPAASAIDIADIVKKPSNSAKCKNGTRKTDIVGKSVCRKTKKKH
jgi:hypothetical protein